MKRMILACLAFAVPAFAGEKRWSDEAIDLFARIPVQEQGRVKPISTQAAFALLRMNHKRSYLDAEEDKHGPTEWLMLTLLFPDQAARERIFLVEDQAVLKAVGMEEIKGRKRRDRYSFEELRPFGDRLVEKAREYEGRDQKKRSPVQGQTILLARALSEFQGLRQFLEFTRYPVDVPAQLASYFDGKRETRVSLALAKLPIIVSERKDGDMAPVEALAGSVVQSLRSARSIALLPPSSVEAEEWSTPADVAMRFFESGIPPSADQIALIAALEEMAVARTSAADFEKAVLAFSRRSAEVTSARGEYAKVEMEVSFYRLDPFYKGLMFYLGAFLLMAVGLLTKARWIPRAVVALVMVGLGFHVTGIVMRCILRGRPPVSTLYETVIFITAVGVLSSLVIEAINRMRIGLTVSTILGALGLFIAMRYEVIDGKDTMPQLLAVLDTNFWLATHVTCITIGYSAGLLAAAIAHVHVLGSLFGFRKGDSAFYHRIGRMVYGVLCFSLLFSVVGTILGGVWANDSWGRFWGWDPKENGALLIVLSQLTIIHGRLGGFLRGHGVSMAAIAGGCIVAFSWWGVNLLGVGLHSYGFTQGVLTALWTFYISQAAVLFAGGVHFLVRYFDRPPVAAD